ncbi:MAG: amidohydrolase family protein [Spirochaetia bacterium]|nr:amidohydrolase family protein [Spirochaetia bacterium]
MRLATIEGAKSLHLEGKIGSLEIGKRADIITIDTEEGLQSPFYREHPDQAFSAVVYNSHGSKVSNTIANGNFLKKNGKVLMDKQEILERASSLGRQLMQSAGLL